MALETIAKGEEALLVCYVIKTTSLWSLSYVVCYFVLVLVPSTSDWVVFRVGWLSCGFNMNPDDLCANGFSLWQGSGLGWIAGSGRC